MTAWTEHIKSFAKEHNMSYGCALSNPACSASYREKRPQKLNKKEKKEVVSMGAEEPTGVINRTNSTKSATHKKRVNIMKSKLDKVRETKENQEMSNNDIPAPPSRVPVAPPIPPPATAVAVAKRKAGRPRKYNTAEEARKMKIVQSIASNKRRAVANKQPSMSGGSLDEDATIDEAYTVFRTMVNMWNTNRDLDEVVNYYEDNFYRENEDYEIPMLADFDDEEINDLQMDADTFIENCRELLQHNPFIIPDTYEGFKKFIQPRGIYVKMVEARDKRKGGEPNPLKKHKRSDSDDDEFKPKMKVGHDFMRGNNRSISVGAGVRNSTNANDSDTSSDGDSGQDSDDGCKLYPLSTLHIAKIVGSGAGASAGASMTDENRILFRRVLAEMSLNVAYMRRQAVPEEEINRRINRDDYIERFYDTALRAENHPAIDREVARLDTLNLLPTAPNTPRKK